MEGQGHHVGLGHHVGGLFRDPVAHPVLGGVAQRGLGHVHAHNLKILKALQGQGQRAADEAQTHNDKGAFHIPFLLTGGGKPPPYDSEP